MKKIVDCILLLLLVSCNVNHRHTLSNKEIIANQITAKVAKKIKADTGLIPVDEIRMLALSFDFRKPVTIE